MFGHPCGFFYPMLENVNFCLKFILFCTQNRKPLADYRMRIPFQTHPTSPRPGAGILPQATEIAILLGTCRKNRKIAGSEIKSIFHWFWIPFWLNVQTILTCIFDPFEALIFACLFGCMFSIFGHFHLGHEATRGVHAAVPGCRSRDGQPTPLGWRMQDKFFEKTTAQGTGAAKPANPPNLHGLSNMGQLRLHKGKNGLQ